MKFFRLLALLLILVTACTPSPAPTAPTPTQPGPAPSPAATVPAASATVAAAGTAAGTAAGSAAATATGGAATATGAAAGPATSTPAGTATTLPSSTATGAAAGPAPIPTNTSSPAPIPSPTQPGAATPTSPAAPGAGAKPGAQPGFPIRAAFYYPWFPNSWNQAGMNPFTHFHPTLGFYSEDTPGVIEKHIAAMQYGKIQAGIASWWGQQHYTNTRFPALLKAGEKMGFLWAIYMESEGQGDPTPDAIRADLTYIRDNYASSPAYLKVNGRFVVYAYADGNDRCGMPERWKEANTVGAYVVLKVFPNYKSCPAQPDAWHQYAPANANESMGQDSFTISPGFYKATEPQPRLERDPARWAASIRAMIASKANWQLITTFNEWGEGTAVENAQEWDSPSGYGVYLDALHNDGK